MIHAWNKPPRGKCRMQNAECRMQNGGWGLSLAAVPSGQLVALKRRSGGLAEAISLR
jgi:hypothetical protein